MIDLNRAKYNIHIIRMCLKLLYILFSPTTTYPPNVLENNCRTNVVRGRFNKTKLITNYQLETAKLPRFAQAK